MRRCMRRKRASGGTHIAEKVEDLGKAGVNALWLPPVSKASDHRSNGYDPYDYFDLGDLTRRVERRRCMGIVPSLRR